MSDTSLGKIVRSVAELISASRTGSVGMKTNCVLFSPVMRNQLGITCSNCPASCILSHNQMLSAVCRQARGFFNSLKFLLQVIFISVPQTLFYWI